MIPDLDRHFLEILKEHTAGEPQTGVKWTNLKPREIAAKLRELGIDVSRRIVRYLLTRHGFSRRKAKKDLSLKSHPDRDRQFRNIARLKENYLAAGQVVISVDTKKKELLGSFYREGRLYVQEPIRVLDHDFPGDGDGKVVPHGIYDLGLNKAHVNVGLSCDTTEFCCESLYRWWTGHGRRDHPGARHLLLLCDGGGSNPSRSHLFKQDLQRFADRTGIRVRVAHYPPYCSKHNPIEHRVFPHVTRACAGVVFGSVELVLELVRRASTSTGLTVTAELLPGEFANGRKALPPKSARLRMRRHATLPLWNYSLRPRVSGKPGV